jgi:hypothetical protein
MKQVILVAFLGALSLFITEVQAQEKTVVGKPSIKDFSIIDKKGVIYFPKMKALVAYVSDSTIHWKTTDANGLIKEGDEKVSYKKLTDNLHFFNWIEKDGFTVSQIIDTRNGTVKAFWSFNDDKSERGKRSSMFVEGKFRFDK